MPDGTAFTFEIDVLGEPLVAHQQWWKDFLRDSAGTGFWHEMYLLRGGMEAVYDDINKPIGMMAFAPLQTARGQMFTARSRLGQGESSLAAVIPEAELQS